MKSFKCIFIVYLALVSAIPTFASRMDEVTLVLVPREDEVVRVGMDLANRYPTLLISYQIGGNGTVSLHGWTGTEWVNVTPEAYQEGAFFHNGPSDVVLVEQDGRPMPESLLPPEEWCSSVHKISTTETRPLLHLIGQHYNFKHSDWQWFASNYKFSIDEINPEGLNIAWYHKPLSEHLRKRNTAVGASDLQYWSVVRQPEALFQPITPVTGEEEEMAVPVEEPQIEDVEPTDEMDGEDLLTNAIPDAVVLGAGDAEEATEAVSAEDSADVQASDDMADEDE